MFAVTSRGDLPPLFTVPETPRWLFQVGRRDEAVDVVRRTTRSPDEASSSRSARSRRASPRSTKAEALLLVRRNRKVILLAFAIAVQPARINAILYYAPDIFRSAGAGDNAALESVIIGLVNLIVTMAALTVIDKIGGASSSSSAWSATP